MVGHGWGHGAGMSQYGARGMAMAGKTHAEILNFYYPGTELSTISGRIRVLITADSADSKSSAPLGDVVVEAVSGLLFDDLGDSEPAQELPAKVEGETATHWSIQQDPNDTAKSILRVKTGTKWTTERKLTGRGEFKRASSAPIGLVFKDGSVKRYRDTIREAITTGNKRQTINELLIDEYTKGVVPSEMPTSWQAEAVRAQAVAARTYGSRSIRAAGTFDICDTTSCQVYRGYDKETTAGNDAVAATKGKVLRYNGALAFTQFSSSNGGASAKGSQPFLVAKVDPYDGRSGNGNPNANWTKTVSAKTLETKYPELGTLKSIKFGTRAGVGEWGGRVNTVTLVGSKKSIEVSGTTMRSVLGLKSHWFAFKK